MGNPKMVLELECSETPNQIKQEEPLFSGTLQLLQASEPHNNSSKAGISTLARLLQIPKVLEANQMVYSELMPSNNNKAPCSTHSQLIHQLKQLPLDKLIPHNPISSGTA